MITTQKAPNAPQPLRAGRQLRDVEYAGDMFTPASSPPPRRKPPPPKPRGSPPPPRVMPSPVRSRPADSYYDVAAPPDYYMTAGRRSDDDGAGGCESGDANLNGICDDYEDDVSMQPSECAACRWQLCAMHNQTAHDNVILQGKLHASPIRQLVMWEISHVHYMSTSHSQDVCYIAPA